MQHCCCQFCTSCSFHCTSYAAFTALHMQLSLHFMCSFHCTSCAAFTHLSKGPTSRAGSVGPTPPGSFTSASCSARSRTPVCSNPAVTAERCCGSASRCQVAVEGSSTNTQRPSPARRGCCKEGCCKEGMLMCERGGQEAVYNACPC